MNDRRVEMIDFDPVKSRACIAFLDSKGRPSSLWIHEDTFSRLMKGPWDGATMGGMPNLFQEELKGAISTSIKGDPVKWFTGATNEVLQSKIGSRNPNENADAKRKAR